MYLWEGEWHTMEATATPKEHTSKMVDSVEPRRVRISSKHQLTIPADLFAKAGLSNEALLEFDPIGKRIIIKPSKPYEGYDFSEELLSDLVHQGLTGQKLITEFSRLKSQIPSALKQMLEDKTNEAKKVPIMTPDMSLDEYLDKLPEEEEDN